MKPLSSDVSMIWLHSNADWPGSVISMASWWRRKPSTTRRWLVSRRVKLTLTPSQAEHLLLEAEDNARMGVPSYRTAWGAIEREARKAVAYAAKRDGGPEPDGSEASRKESVR